MFSKLRNCLYFNFYGKQRVKKSPIQPCGIKSTTKVEQPALEQWMNDMNAGKGFTNVLTFEDPAYVSTAGDMQTKYKKELIIKAQNKFNNL